MIGIAIRDGVNAEVSGGVQQAGGIRRPVGLAGEYFNPGRKEVGFGDGGDGGIISFQEALHGAINARAVMIRVGRRGRAIEIGKQIMDTTDANKWDAGLYDDKHSFVWKLGAALIDLLEPRAGERVLDLGCGTGHLTAQIAAAGATLLGIDSSPQMIEEGRRNHPGIRFEVQDARNLDYVEPFDAVFSNAVLHWVVEAEQVVQGIARALKPGGRCIISRVFAGGVSGMVST